jgi:hypothetical protein
VLSPTSEKDEHDEIPNEMLVKGVHPRVKNKISNVGKYPDGNECCLRVETTSDGELTEIYDDQDGRDGERRCVVVQVSTNASSHWRRPKIVLTTTTQKVVPSADVRKTIGSGDSIEPNCSRREKKYSGPRKKTS